MKKALMAAVAMVVIIVVQMVLSYGFSYHAGELFCKVSVGALFTYCLIDIVRSRKNVVNAN